MDRFFPSDVISNHAGALLTIWSVELPLSISQPLAIYNLITSWRLNYLHYVDNPIRRLIDRYRRKNKNNDLESNVVATKAKLIEDIKLKISELATLENKLICAVILTKDAGCLNNQNQSTQSEELSITTADSQINALSIRSDQNYWNSDIRGSVLGYLNEQAALDVLTRNPVTTQPLPPSSTVIAPARSSTQHVPTTDTPLRDLPSSQQ
ncbi:BZIP domain-containing protein [Caenorhabditis elegans]|uniref:BZIP domain-containing protein n=1 Tax=Caenorhabditis elegans TaxID=6239 RepID=O17158_CAEEL|nr:BZIP domain-containing protein [Caenorhabditis elegans]CCD62832.1 BZIP domain-containing protein [Caenorhabditis elegans]|eukprot:NP_493729.2 Uncharacterized protein CELE_C24H12.6 [Caenorhabditis elegans]